MLSFNQSNNNHDAFFGLLHCNIIEAQNILYSYNKYKRGLTNILCGKFRNTIVKDRASPVCVIDLNVYGNIIRVGRTKVEKHNNHPKWNNEIIHVLDIDDLYITQAKNCYKITDENFNYTVHERSDKLELIIRILDTNKCKPTTTSSLLYNNKYFNEVLAQGYLDLALIVKAKVLRTWLTLNTSINECSNQYSNLSKTDGSSSSSVDIIESNEKSHKIQLFNRLKNATKVKFKKYAKYLYKLKDDSKERTRVKIELRFFSCIPRRYANSIRNIYFPMTHGNHVVFYQDATYSSMQKSLLKKHLGINSIIGAWDDIYDTISAAKYFVFISSWSIHPEILLIRKEFSTTKDYETLGELLKYKANQGLNVVIQTWQDKTSRENIRFLKEGLMNTYYVYAKTYFKNTKVKIYPIQRIALDDNCDMREFVRWSAFTHHQKVILCDYISDRNNANAKSVVAAFIGGLDLTIGRYDTQNHYLFKSMYTYHKNEYYNNCIPAATINKHPREPWHDVHCKIIGPAAWDLLQNFFERTMKQNKQAKSSVIDYIQKLIDQNKLAQEDSIYIKPTSKNSYDIQIARSLDSEAAIFKKLKWKSLFSNINTYVDKSLHIAYCYTIKQAKSFIYIESQYFLGSSQFWGIQNVPFIRNLVPFNIVSRIVKAIQEDKDFKVYIVIPLFPEGNPSSIIIQEILFWQSSTMNYMFSEIERNIKLYNRNSMVNDYINFFFLGQTESNNSISLPSESSLINNTSSKHQIYVHSKLLIADDEIALLGSANINDRSLNGSRDTDIIAIIRQPYYKLIENNKQITIPNGGIHKFRLSLWIEHFKLYSDLFKYPYSKDCLELVIHESKKNFDSYIRNTIDSDERGHICLYPINNYINAEASNIKIPGLASSIVGAQSYFLPTGLTC